MNLGMLPVVGVPLPLLSYGGSSLLAVMIALGLALNVSTRRFLF
jgi:rod shape determining protein RodA